MGHEVLSRPGGARPARSIAANAHRPAFGRAVEDREHGGRLAGDHPALARGEDPPGPVENLQVVCRAQDNACSGAPMSGRGARVSVSGAACAAVIRSWTLVCVEVSNCSLRPARMGLRST